MNLTNKFLFSFSKEPGKIKIGISKVQRKERTKLNNNSFIKQQALASLGHCGISPGISGSGRLGRKSHPRQV